MSLFSYRDYRHLFAAQVVALFGTGLTTVALGLLAYQLAGADAAAVLGTALAIKMIAYVTVAPIAAAHADRVPRRLMLVCLDLTRATVVVALPFIDQAMADIRAHWGSAIGVSGVHTDVPGGHPGRGLR